MTSEFGAATESAPLRRAILDRIAAEGGISFRDFMEMALYHPTLGYYTSERDKIGHEGDYLTSPEVSPIFGVLLGRLFREIWQEMGRPSPLDLVEAGAGTGALARDVLAWARNTAPEFFAAIRYTIVEISLALASRQRMRLEAEGLAGSVEWRDELPPSIKGCLYANELLDAMPVHKVVMNDGAVREVYVVAEGDSLAEELRDPAKPVLEYFSRLGVTPGEACYAEVNLEAARWWRAAADSLAAGYLLTLDYGYEASDLYAPWRQQGTLLCFYRHNPNDDPYIRIGRQDITSHVDFTTIRRVGEEAGLRTVGTATQSELLVALGIAEAVAAAAREPLEEQTAVRRAVIELTDSAGLGRIRALAQSRGYSGPLTGLDPP